MGASSAAGSQRSTCSSASSGRKPVSVIRTETIYEEPNAAGEAAAFSDLSRRAPGGGDKGLETLETSPDWEEESGSDDETPAAGVLAFNDSPFPVTEFDMVSPIP
jgi:hypothetical protein